LVLIDYDGDFIIRQETGFFGSLQELIRYSIISLLLLFGLIGLFNISSLLKIKSIGQSCLIIILFTNGYGLLLGLLLNNHVGAIREFAAISPICLIPIFLKICRDKLLEIALYLIYALVFIVAIKLLISQFYHVFIFDSLSWKIMLRSSPLLLLPYAYILISLIKSDSQKKNIFLLFIIVIEVLVAQARALNAAILIITSIIILIRPVNRRIFIPAIIIAISAMSAIFFTDGSIENIFGFWSGVHFDESANYRIEQLDILVDRYISRPLTGFGFGYYTIGYLTYGDLVNSFLLELDLINFSTKIGLPFSIIYFSGYILLIIQNLRNKYHDPKTHNIVVSYLLTLILLLFYSLFQTAHSSILYWLVYALSFSLIFSNSRYSG
jgi:hypothetical protein